MLEGFLGRFDEKMALLHEVMGILDKIHGDATLSADKLDVLLELAHAAASNKQRDQALLHLEKAQVLHSSLRLDPLLHAEVRMAVGAILGKMGEVEAQVRILEQAVKEQESLFGTDLNETVAVSKSLVSGAEGSETPAGKRR